MSADTDTDVDVGGDSDLDGLDPDETVYVVTNRHTSKPRAYHTDRDCTQLDRALDGVVIDRPARAVVPWRDQCKTCAGTRDLSRVGTPKMGCPFCGAKESLPYHLPCDEAPTDTPGPGESTGTPRPTPAPAPTPEQDTDADGEGGDGEDGDSDLGSRSWICDRPGCEEPLGRNLQYCSRECHDIARPNRVEITCEFCGGTKEVKASRGDQRFCQPLCYRGHQKFIAPYQNTPGVNDE